MWTKERLAAAARRLASVAHAYAPAHIAVPHGAPSPRPGDSLAVLRAVWRLTVDRGEPLPVSSEACDTAAFPSPADNHAFRAWHDLAHIQSGGDFTVGGELRVLAIQQEDVRHYEPADEWGAQAIDDACALLEAEVLGQTLYYQVHGAFPNDQTAFELAYLNHGAAAACCGAPY